jgi:DNA-binding NtrC family response regulator
MVHFKKLINIASPVLITGATGTGKSKMARKLFDLSGIHKEKFLTVHLASLKEDLFESELFGHKKGSFTGAVENKSGYLYETGKGTLFLDEIGELSLESQKKLLYLLEEKKYTPVGSTVAMTFEGRMILATNKNLKELVEQGKFREDLFFRLTIFQLELESISSNKEKLNRDIHRFFELFKQQYHKQNLKMSAELMQDLLDCQWAGNFRELKNCLEFMVAMSESGMLERGSLPAWFSGKTGPEKSMRAENFISHFPKDFNDAIEKFEAWYLKEMLTENKGRVNETARHLGISKTTLIGKARKYGIDTLMLRAVSGREKLMNLAA